MTGSPLLLLLIAYNNGDEVRDFIDHARRRLGDSVSIAVCDNSLQPDEIGFADADVAVHRPENPGYWGGGMAALEAYRAAGNFEPSWVGLSNTDLTFERTDTIELLNEWGVDRPLVVAPRITEGEDRVEKNPHLSRARSTTRLKLNHLATATPRLAYMYLVLTAAKYHAARAVGRVPSLVDLPSRGTAMHSPYGALIFMNRRFLEAATIPDHVPLLAEEWAIADGARRIGAKVVFEPGIHVLHDPHTTTGPKVGMGRAHMLSTAFKFINEEVDQ